MCSHFIIRQESARVGELPECTISDCKGPDILAFIDGNNKVRYLSMNADGRYGFRTLHEWEHQISFIRNTKKEAVEYLQSYGHRAHRFTNPKAFFKWAAEVS